MSKYTWVEVPTWAFINSGKSRLSCSEVTLVIHFCSKVDEKGLISVDDLAFISLKLGYDPKNLIPILEKFEKAGFMFRFTGPDGTVGNYVNFVDNRQSIALFNTPVDEKDDSVRRTIFPLEISLDKQLNIDDLRFLALCLTYSDLEDKSFIKSDFVMALIQLFDLEFQAVKDTMHKLQDLGYVNISQDPPGLFMLWQYPQSKRNRFDTSFPGSIGKDI